MRSVLLFRRIFNQTSGKIKWVLLDLTLQMIKKSSCVELFLDYFIDWFLKVKKTKFEVLN